MVDRLSEGKRAGHEPEYKYIAAAVYYLLEYLWRVFTRTYGQAER